MKRSLLLANAVIALCLCKAAVPVDDTTLIGTWKGRSICQVKDSPCHDEIAAYHISKTEKPNVFRMIMNKVVNGKEEDMGVIDYLFDAAAGTLTYNDKSRDAVWQFKVKGNSMDGTLYYKGQLYRVIKLTKDN